MDGKFALGFHLVGRVVTTSLTRDKLVEDTVDQEQTTMDKRLVTLSAFFPSTGEQFSEMHGSPLVALDASSRLLATMSRKR